MKKLYLNSRIQALIVSTVLALTTIGAEATCTSWAGKAVPKTTETSWGKEQALQGTCDGDLVYRGRVRNLQKRSNTSVSMQFWYRTRYITQATSRDAAGMRFTFWARSSAHNGAQGWRLRANNGYYRTGVMSHY